MGSRMDGSNNGHKEPKQSLIQAERHKPTPDMAMECEVTNVFTHYLGGKINTFW